MGKQTLRAGQFEGRNPEGGDKSALTMVEHLRATERERCAKIAEQMETWTQTVEDTDHNDLYTGTYSSVQRTTPKWRDGAAIAKAIRELR